MLNNYKKGSIEKISKLTIEDFSHPFNLKLYYLTLFSPRDKKEYINRLMHKHAFCEVHFILNGFCEWRTAAETNFTISAGEGVLFMPNINHQVNHMSKDVMRLTITFGLEGESSLEEHLSKKDVWHFAVPQRILDSIDVILYETDQKSGFSPSLIQSRMLDIFCTLFRSTGYHGQSDYVTLPSDSESFIVAKAKQYIQDNVDKMLSCKEVADYCHFHAKYLSKLFANQTGQTLLDYIHTTKINKAEELLADDALTLKQISTKLGFANEYYFNYFFKRINGIPPGHFRKIMAKHKD